MRCPNCVGLSGSNARYCGNCGRRLQQALPASAAGASAPQVYMAATTPGANQRHAALPQGTLLQGRYKVVHEVGRGAYGCVYLVEDIVTGANMAIKQVEVTHIRDASERAEVVALFKREVETLQNSQHPHIVVIHRHWYEDPTYGPFYYVMDYVHGKTIDQVLADAGGRVDWHRVVDWGIVLCEVLSYLHRQKPPIIYRDMKPPNVMLDERSGNPILIDFGTARAYATTNTAIGTFGYVRWRSYVAAKGERRGGWRRCAPMAIPPTQRRPVGSATVMRRCAS